MTYSFTFERNDSKNCFSRCGWYHSENIYLYLYIQRVRDKTKDVTSVPHRRVLPDVTQPR